MGRIITPDDLPNRENIISEKVYVSQESYDDLVQIINKPAQPSEALKRLFINANKDFDSGEELGGI